MTSNFVKSLKIAESVFEQYKVDRPKWWKRIDGIPILTDVAVRMAQAFVLPDGYDFSDLGEAQNTIDNLEQQFSAKDAEITTLRTKIEKAALSESASVEREIQLNGEIQALKQEVEMRKHLDTIAANAIKSLVDINIALKDENSALKEKVTALEKELKETQHQLRSAMWEKG